MTTVQQPEPSGNTVTISPGMLESVDRELLGALTVHELREPLQAIQSFLSIVLSTRAGSLTPLQSDFLATAKRACWRLERQIEDVRFIVSGGTELRLQPTLIDLGEHIRICCQELAPFAAEQGVRIAAGNDLGVPPVRSIRADARRIDQILLNLMENAVKHARQDTEVCVSTARGPGGSVAVVIENTVEGHLGRDLENWFQPYYRGVTSTAYDGYGLGLVVSAYLVRAHGGEIMAAIRDHHVRVGFILPRVPAIRESAFQVAAQRVAT